MNDQNGVRVDRHVYQILLIFKSLHKKSDYFEINQQKL